MDTKSPYSTYIIIQTLSIDLSRTSELWLWYSFDFFLIETYVPLKKLVATLSRISLYIESNQSFWGLLSKFLTPLTNSYFLLSHGSSETCVLSGPKVSCFRGSSVLIGEVSALIIMVFKLTANSGIIPVEEYLIIVVHIVEKLLLFGVKLIRGLTNLELMSKSKFWSELNNNTMQKRKVYILSSICLWRIRDDVLFPRPILFI